MEPRKDYTKSSFKLTGLVVLLLLGVSFIPPATIFGVSVKRANIVSDIVEVRDETRGALPLESILDTSFLVGFEFPEPVDASYPEETYTPEEEKVPATDTIPGIEPYAAGTDTLPNADTVSHNASAGFSRKASLTGMTCAAVADTTLVSIEDFSPGETMMNRFYNALAYESAERVVRIAVLGDSFTESDIITGDIREDLQLAYGGRGVGFVPFSSPLSKYRKTVNHTFSGWDYYNIIQKKSVPEKYKDKFFISGILSVPKAGASATYEGVQFRNGIEAANTATLLFANQGESVIKAMLNDSLAYTYVPPRSDSMGFVRISEGDIYKLGVEIAKPEGFIGYGVVLEDSTGVSVHNYSVRSNSGLALFGTDAGVNRAINSLMNYDLIILQYGLNVMSSDIFDYGYYERHLTRLIAYIKQCFPGSAILIMSIGDRSTLKSGTAVTMPEVKAMLKTQRNAAVKGGVGFWNTLEGMGGENSMAGFVKNQWAAKDHTHINYNGGRQIALRLTEYVKAAVESIKEQDGQRRNLTRAELDAMLHETIDAQTREISADKLIETGFFWVGPFTLEGVPAGKYDDNN